jgi:hypothetical protein
MVPGTDWQLRTFVLALALLAPWTGAASGAEPAKKRLAIELNRLQDTGKACRMSLVFTNHLDEPVEALSIETVLFDKEGGVSRFLVLKSRALPPGKIRVQQFDIAGTKCDAFGKLLLNDIKECKVGDLKPGECLALVSPSSRAGIPFISTTANQQ